MLLGCVNTKKAMNAADLKRPPLDYSPEERNWCQATIDFMEGQLDENQRIRRGLPTRRTSSRTKVTVARPILSPQRPGAAEADVEDDKDMGPTSRLHQFV